MEINHHPDRLLFPRFRWIEPDGSFERTLRERSHISMEFLSVLHENQELIPAYNALCARMVDKSVHWWEVKSAPEAMVNERFVIDAILERVDDSCRELWDR